MKIEPDFSDDVVILVKNKRTYTWYVNEKEVWILDLLKLDNAFRRKMGLSLVDETHEEGERKGFEILDSYNIDFFQIRMKKYEVSYKELKEYHQIYSEVYLEGKYMEVFPSFFIDFDNKTFFSYFSEPGSYEDFVPNRWIGVYKNKIDLSIIEEAIES